MLLCAIFKKGLALVFSDLKLLLADVEQVKYCLIVNFNVWAFYFEIYRLDIFIGENSLIV